MLLFDACLEMSIYDASDINVCLINRCLLYNSFWRNFMEDSNDFS